MEERFAYYFATNKVDEISDKQKSVDFDKELLMALCPTYIKTIVRISAKNQVNIDTLKYELSYYVESLKSDENNVVITNQRHYQALQKSLDSVLKVEEAITHNIQTELLAYELRTALEHLGEISGTYTNDEILGNIFSKFCIGK